MYRTIEDFVTDWEYESGATMKILRALTDASLKQKVTADGRSLGFLAWHLVLCLSESGSMMGVQVTAPAEDSEQPHVAAEIASTYDISSKSLLEAIRRSWTGMRHSAFTNRTSSGCVTTWRRGTAVRTAARISGTDVP